MKSCIITLLLTPIAASATAQVAPNLTAAERQVIDCMGRTVVHAPYAVPVEATLRSCQVSIDVYKQACLARGNSSSWDCSYAAITLAMASIKKDPIDVQFMDCLMGKARVMPSGPPIQLLSACREERQLFEVSCLRRKAAKQCDEDQNVLAESAAQLKGRSPR